MIWTVSVISLAGVTCHWTSFISHQNFSGWVNLFRCQASIFWTNRIDMGKISSREFHVKSAWKDEKSHHNLFSGEFLMKNVTCKCHVQIRKFMWRYFAFYAFHMQNIFRELHVRRAVVSHEKGHHMTFFMGITHAHFTWNSHDSSFWHFPPFIGQISVQIYFK